MANIKRIEGKTGVSYKITVTKGRDLEGKQIRHYKTWTPERPMTARQMEKEVQKVAFDFEREIETGYELDNRQTFAQYADYVVGQKEANGTKHNTILEYRHLLKRIDQAIGSMKLVDIRPQHLNRFYQSLQAGDATIKAKAMPRLMETMKTRGISRDALAATADGVSRTTITKACRGETIMEDKARAISTALGADVKDLFDITRESKPLSGKTRLEYHRLIHTVLAQAEREMLVPYNAAGKATPPTVKSKDPDCFQPNDIRAILDALEQEPEKWRVLVHLLTVTGCRRGEVAAIKWSRVDLDRGRIEISGNLCYSKQRGIYETTPKNGNSRFVNIPAETVAILRHYRAEQAKLRLANGDRWKDTGYIFTRDDGLPMNPTSITAWLNKFSERHGLPHIHPHSFRHSVASILISAGTDIVTVSKQLGHTQVSTTADIYSHAIEEAKAQATECIANIMLRRKQA